ncbi:MAG: hypothetical protein CVU40_00900 [Chloroflexi bacterium HGW-Chloroflexi-2]|jgi:hypothetical protein|nr:MAG: hypothetical protein CVU40_00900 [Chloroflexi bacterium HGW-Chloroflexi-2]
MNSLIDILPVLLAGLSSLILFIKKKWRWNILAMAAIYVSVFWMVLQVWPTGLAVIKLIAGWMAGAILGSAVKEDSELLVEDNKVEQRFKFVIVMIIWIFSFSIMQSLKIKLPIPDSLLWGGVLLIIMGILQIGMSTRPVRIIFGLLTAFSGFEVLYAGVEQSVLVAGFLVIITLGIALVGVLFIQQEEGEIV